MGIAGIESVIYEVDDLAECLRFYQDFGLTLLEQCEDWAVLETLVGQTLRLDTQRPSYRRPAVETQPGVREVVWGVDTPGELDRLVGAVAKDREVRATPDGVYHFADESGFGVGLTLGRLRPPPPPQPQLANTYGEVARWNRALDTVGRVAPIRMCHVALNIEMAGRHDAVAFYLDRLEFRATDVVKPMGVFMQCEGDDDQHNLLLCHRPDRTGTNHVSFEVPGFDEVIEGGNYMIERGWREARQLGRHTVGSNVFRFLHSPAGGRAEYAADMDRVDRSYGTRVHETAPPHHIWTLRTNRDQEQERA